MILNKRDSKERIAFVRFWTSYMKKVKNEDWSSQQALLINSVLKSVNNDPDLYIKVRKKLMNKAFGIAKGARMFERYSADRI